MTQRDQMQTALQSRGWAIDTNARTRKYLVMKPPTGEKHRIYLGKSGALRYSEKGTVATAYPQDTLKTKLLASKKDVK